MMIPIPRRGTYRGLEGLAGAHLVAGVIGVSITVDRGQIIAPPPDGVSYLGFIFARASSPAEAENALRVAHRRLHFDIRPRVSGDASARSREAMTLNLQILVLDATEVVASDPDEAVSAPTAVPPYPDSSGCRGRTGA